MIKITGGERVRSQVVYLLGSAYQVGYTSQNFDGAINKIVIKQYGTGSFFVPIVQISGTNETVLNTGTTNASGTSTVFYPRLQVQDSGGNVFAEGSGLNSLEPYTAAGPIKIAGSQISTAGSLAFIIYYR